MTSTIKRKSKVASTAKGMTNKRLYCSYHEFFAEGVNETSQRQISVDMKRNDSVS